MKLQLIRTHFTSDYTEGHLFVLAKPKHDPPVGATSEPKRRGTDEASRGQERCERLWEYECDTLERGYDPQRSLVAGSCKCVAPGTYRVVTGWSKRFRRLMPYLCDVPGRSGVMIHPGNTPADSTGCILLGMYVRPGVIARSRLAFQALYLSIEEAYQKGEEVTIEIK